MTKSLTKGKPVSPHQNVSPTRSAMFDKDGKLLGNTLNGDGGVPLRLSLAAGMAGHLALKFANEDTVDIAFALADRLIARYNDDLAKELP